MSRRPGAYEHEGRLFFVLLNGDRVSCNCIRDQHAVMVAAACDPRTLAGERKWGSPEWGKCRSPEELAKHFDYEGYADGDSGYLHRGVSYGEAEMIQRALRSLPAETKP